MGEDAVTWNDTKHETKRYELCKLPEQNMYNCTTWRLRRRENVTKSWINKLNPNHRNSTWCNACICTKCTLWWMEWNRLKLLPGRNSQIQQQTAKKNDCTQLTNVTMPTNPCETGNLQKVLTVKINARVMITTNIDVTDRLKKWCNGYSHKCSNWPDNKKMNVILVAFDSEHVGQETRYASVYNSRNQNAVAIHQTQATFSVHKKHYFKQLGCSFH